MRPQFSGVWNSSYQYESSSRPGSQTGTHEVEAHQNGRTVIFESIRGKNDSYLLIRLTIDDNVATGTWQEATDPSGHYGGAVYYGALQMMVEDGGKRLRGKWVGFGKDGEVNTGPWELAFAGSNE